MSAFAGIKEPHRKHEEEEEELASNEELRRSLLLFWGLVSTYSSCSPSTAFFVVTVGRNPSHRLSRRTPSLRNASDCKKDQSLSNVKATLYCATLSMHIHFSIDLPLYSAK